jgi:hypothetical protein
MKIVEYQKRIDGGLVTRFHIPEAQTVEADRLLTEISCPAASHGNCRPVLICAVDQPVYAMRIERHSAKPIENFYFDSAITASLHFGYHWDAVGQALKRAERRGCLTAELVGVTFRWADEAPGLD